jgi:Domain of unknown function (DUF4116)
MDWSDIDDSLQDNVAFVLRAVSERPDLYMDLPLEMREIEEIALEALRGKGSEVQDNVILEATERVPSLLSHREAMLSVAKNDMTDVFQETLQFSPIEIRSDKEIMLAAVKHAATAFEYCSEELQHDRDIVQAAIESCPTSLYLVSEDFQSEHPDIVITAIERTDPDELWSTYDDIHGGLWQNKDVAQAWLKEGGDWLDDDFPEEFCEDEDLMLTVAEYNWTEFEYASDYLKGDKEFMLKAVAKDGRVFNEACYTLRNDVDLALAAFSKSREAIQFFSGEDEDFEFMVKFSRHVWERLAEYDVFTKQVLGAIDIKDDSCRLSMLNQGPETCLEYKQIIASYLGLPQAKELKQLQEASRHLRHWGL